ncbi:MAG: translocation/assembly module TamB domain-containing protein [Deltaproteobacteria bacterium]|nr:translocation/assembly module TamB domain-containing protein [Deltaproteobacteria bacterium]
MGSSGDDGPRAAGGPRGRAASRARPGAPSSGGRRDWGGLLARLFCALFAVIGAIPLALGAVVRLPSVQDWAARKTAALIETELGLTASYRVRVVPWPLGIAIDELQVESSDGGEPFLRAERVLIRPRLFALLDGELDIGEVRVEEPYLRAVVVNGHVSNLALRAPTGGPPPEPKRRLPLAALSVSNARLDVSVDGLRVRTRGTDVDLTVDESTPGVAGALPPQPVELSLRSGSVAVDRAHPSPTGERLDEDRICRLQARARVSSTEMFLRRLDLEGAVDLDPGPATRPSCELVEGDWRRLDVSAAGVRVALDAEGVQRVEGRVRARLPLPAVHRFVDVSPVSGAVELDASDLEYVRGAKLPRLRATLSGTGLGFSSKSIAERFEAKLELEGDEVRAHELAVGWSGGTATIDEVRVSPFAAGLPLAATGVTVREVAFARLFEALNGSPNAHVAWQLERVRFDTFGGTLSPLALRGPIAAETRDFAVFDRPAWREDRKRLVGLASARLAGEFEVADAGIFLNDLTITGPKSRILTNIKLLFVQELGVSLKDGTVLDLSDLSPLADLEVAGRARIRAETTGAFTHPKVRGDLTLEDFVIAGLPAGTLAGTVAFEPVRLDLTDATLTHDASIAKLPHLVLDFGRAPAALVMSARVDTRASGFDVQDFLEILRLEQEPLYRDLRGRARGSADTSFVYGGPEDACGGGRLSVSTRLALEDVRALGQRFDSGTVELDYLWDDRLAGSQGVVVDVHALTLRRGEGTIVGRTSIRHDAEIQGDFTATALPLEAVDMLGLERRADRVLPEGTVSGVARFDGTLQRLRGMFDVSISPVRIGPAMLPSSRIEIVMVPESRPVAFEGKSACDHRLVKASAASPDDASGDGSSEEAATFQLRKGSLFGGQATLEDMILTRGERPMLREGTVRLEKLDLGALANLIGGVAFSSDAPVGTATGELRLEQMPLDNPALGEARFRIDELALSRGGTSMRVGKVDQELALTADSLKIPTLPLTISPRRGLEATVVVSGRVEELSTIPRFDVHAQLTPLDLGKLTTALPFVSRAGGVVSGGLRLDGPYFLPTLSGELRLERGLVRLTGVNLPLDDVNVRVLIRNGEIEIKEATARTGGFGQLSLTAQMPLRGLDVAEVNATLTARDVALPLADGVKATANAALKLAYRPGVGPKATDASAASSGGRALPQVSGTVSLSSFTYARPIAFRLDLDQLTGKSRTVVETYDPNNDLVTFDVAVVSPRPLRVVNNLIDTSLEVSQPGLRLTGTNQRFGARGSLRLEPNSKLFIQGHDFRIREGRIDFDNPTRVTPRLDVLAETEIRRYASSGTTSTASATTGGADASASAGNVWRVTMHATGDTEAPALQLSSDPPLGQDDIVLLLQLGMTRAELDRGLASSLAQSVSLEALSALTGFDQALRKTVPLIDDFRLGTQYSSRTGRPEPTVSIGKRITENLRATVTTGLSDNRELRSNVEWKLKRGVILQGSYDNVNDISSSAIGNLGADLRWRIEFE